LNKKWRLDFRYQTLGSVFVCLISTSANRFFLQPVCDDEIRNLINNLDTHKATSPDDIPVLVLKNCKLVIAPWLAKLINECLYLEFFQIFLRWPESLRCLNLVISPFATIIVQYLYYRTLQKSLKGWCILGFHPFKNKITSYQIFSLVFDQLIPLSMQLIIIYMKNSFRR